MEFASPYLNGASLPINFWGLKTTHCALGGDAWRVTENGKRPKRPMNQNGPDQNGP